MAETKEKEVKRGFGVGSKVQSRRGQIEEQASPVVSDKVVEQSVVRATGATRGGNRSSVIKRGSPANLKLGVPFTPNPQANRRLGTGGVAAGARNERTASGIEAAALLYNIP